MIPDCTEETQAAQSSAIDVGISPLSISIFIYMFLVLSPTFWKFIGVFQLMEGDIYNLFLHF